jgi:hypothetical protein
MHSTMAPVNKVVGIICTVVVFVLSLSGPSLSVYPDRIRSSLDHHPAVERGETVGENLRAPSDGTTLSDAFAEQYPDSTLGHEVSRSKKHE